MMNYPGVESYLDEVVKAAERDGYTTTLFGRRRLIGELRAQNANLRAFGKRVAMNAPIQGTAADIMKLAMIRVHRRLLREGMKSCLIMQVHDELILESPKDEVARARAILKEEMESAAVLSLPLTVEVTSGKNWLEQE
jgi:DNA polymerase-1